MKRTRGDPADAVKKPKVSKASESEGRKFYEEKLNQLRNELENVERGEHDQLILQSKDAEEERDRLLKDAETMRELRLQEARALYAYDCKAATESFENTIKDLKSNLISEINEQTKRLEDLRDGVTEAEVRASSRKLRQKQHGENDTGEEGIPSGCGDKILGMNLFISEENVGNDMKLIQADWKAAAEKFLSKEAIKEQEVKVVDGALYFNELIFEKENFVMCTTEATKEEFHGYIQKMNHEEILVKLMDGTQTRILVIHLRNGRCKIAPAEDLGST